MSLREIFERLGTGERWWAAEIVLRTAGLLLLGMAALAVFWLYRSVHLPPLHEASGVELLEALAVVAGGCGGGMLTFFGPSLFERVPVPRGSAALKLWNVDGRDSLPLGLRLDSEFPPLWTVRMKVELWVGGLIVLFLLIYLLAMPE